MLAVRNRAELEPLLRQAVGEPEADQDYFERYLAAAQPTERANDPNLYAASDIATQWSSFWFGIVPDEEELLRGETDLFRMLRGSSGRPFLIVDPEIPDGILFDEFKRWLTTFRTQHTSPVRRAGRPSNTPNTKITERHFATWVNRAVLPIFDLDWYADCSGQQRFGNRAIGAIFAPKSTKDLKAWGRAARAAVRNALAAEAAVAALIPGAE